MNLQKHLHHPAVRPRNPKNTKRLGPESCLQRQFPTIWPAPVTKMNKKNKVLDSENNDSTIKFIKSHAFRSIGSLGLLIKLIKDDQLSGGPWIRENKQQYWIASLVATESLLFD